MAKWRWGRSQWRRSGPRGIPRPKVLAPQGPQGPARLKKVFGCPCVFKRYQPQSDGSLTTDFKQLQQGCRGIFVGFPEDQAGWLVYVPEKVGNSHLVVSMDVSFDQHFVSGITGSTQEFDGSQMVRNVGKSGGNRGKITESTGDITNLIDNSTSHWGDKQTFDSEHN